LLRLVNQMLSNAVKFTPEGGAVFLRVEREGNWAVLKIRDTGIRIPPEKLPFVFDRFYQADDESTRAAEGMRLRETASAHGAGIGLALTGYSGTRFIRFIRLSRARRLLLESDLNISEVAFQAGFNDPVYFTRVFRREFGVTPSGFREKGGKAV